MANRHETIYLLDDYDEEENEELKGFEDSPVDKPDEDDKDAGLELGGEVKKETEDKDDASSKEDDTKPEIDPAEQRYNETIALMTKKDQQIETLVNQVQTLTETVTAKPEVVKEPPQKPQFTQQQWEDDTEACTEAMIDYSDRAKAFETDQTQAINDEKTKKDFQNLRAIHTKDLADEFVETPSLNNPNIKKAWDDIYLNMGFHQQPDGVIRATRELKRQAKEKNVDLAQFEPGYVKPEPKADDAEALKRQGAEDEAERQKRITAGNMQPSKNSSTDNKINLSPAQLATCKKLDVSPAAYAKTLAAMPASKGGK